MDGAEEATHDAIREPGSFRTVLGAVALSKIENISFGIQATLHARNANEIEAIGFLAAQLGADHVSFAMMQPTGTPLDQNFWLSASDWRGLYERIQHLSGVLRIPVNAPEGWPNSQTMALCGPLRGDTIHIDVQGRLSLCCLHSGIAGGDGSDIAGPVADGLREPHARLVDITHRALRAKLDRTWSAKDAWSDFGCNTCLADFGKPHWSDAGAQGPAAARERWQGAWTRTADGKRVLRLLPDRRTG